MAIRIGLVIDCSDPDRLGAFWSAALGYTMLGAAGNYALLVDEKGSHPKLLLQRVPETKTAKNRMHLDIETPDVQDEVDLRIAIDRGDEGRCRFELCRVGRSRAVR